MPSSSSTTTSSNSSSYSPSDPKPKPPRTLSRANSSSTPLALSPEEYESSTEHFEDATSHPSSSSTTFSSSSSKFRSPLTSPRSATNFSAFLAPALARKSASSSSLRSQKERHAKSPPTGGRPPPLKLPTAEEYENITDRFKDIHIPSSSASQFTSITNSLPASASSYQASIPSVTSSPLIPSSTFTPNGTSTKPPIHPFANTTAKLELIPSGSDSGIDIEEEARLYDELLASRDQDGQSERVTIYPRPPSLHGTNTPSLFSADIYLGDNTGKNSSSPAFARDVRISGWTQVGDVNASKSPTIKQGMGIGGGAYVVYDCVITTKEGTTMHILKRYSAFVELDEALKRTLPHNLQPYLPPLPPKSALARFRPAFLDSRRRRLQFWLASVLLHPDVGGRKEVRKWVME